MEGFIKMKFKSRIACLIIAIMLLNVLSLPMVVSAGDIGTITVGSGAGPRGGAVTIPVTLSASGTNITSYDITVNGAAAWAGNFNITNATSVHGASITNLGNSVRFEATGTNLVATGTSLPIGTITVHVLPGATVSDIGVLDIAGGSELNGSFAATDVTLNHGTVTVTALGGGDGGGWFGGQGQQFFPPPPPMMEEGFLYEHEAWGVAADVMRGGILLNGEVHVINERNQRDARANGFVNINATGRNDGTTRPAVFTISANTLRMEWTYARDNGREFEFRLNTPVGSFILPANIQEMIPNWAALSSSVGGTGNVSIRVTIQQRPLDRHAQIIQRRGLYMDNALSPLVSFTMEMVNSTTGALLASVDRFEGEISKTLPLTGTLTADWTVLTRSGPLADWEETGFIPAVIDGDNIVITTTTNSDYIVVPFRSILTDLEEDAWYTRYVTTAESRRLIEGFPIEDSVFRMFKSNAEVTRAEFVTMMDRVLRLPAAAAGTRPYTDVASGFWGHGSIMRARSAGLITFMGADIFQPNAAITREEMAGVLAAAAAYADFAMTREAVNLDIFTDAEAINPNRAEAIEDVVRLNLMRGRADGSFGPRDTLTRAEAATVLVRFARTAGWLD